MRISDHLICPHCGTRAKRITALYGKPDLYGQLGRSVERAEGLTTCRGCNNPVTIIRTITTVLKVKPKPKEKPKLDPQVFVMTMRSVGNPDFGQYAPVSPKETVYGKTLTEMKKLHEAYNTKWELGGGNHCNPVVKRNGKIVGYFSYNGRFWPGTKYDPNAKEIDIDSWEAGRDLGRKEMEKGTP